MKARIFGKLCITFCNQGAAAPLLDYCNVNTEDGRMFFGRALLLTPWRRDQYRESLPQRALVIAWESRLPVWWAHWRPRRPVTTRTSQYDGMDMAATNFTEPKQNV